MMTAWLNEAYKHLGLREIAGSKTNPTIGKWLHGLKAWWSDDATAWCGTFVAHCCKTAKLPLPKHWYRARDWLNWGVAIPMPVVGCVVVFERTGGGHVGFVVGKNKEGNLMVLGGNQGDAVTVAAFQTSRVLGYRWPDTTFINSPLPTIASNGKISTNES